jgi:hypothetical protein
MKEKSKYFSRYYFSRIKGQGYKIQDRKLHIHIAVCDFREAAALIVRALNQADMTIEYRQGFAEGTVD